MTMIEHQMLDRPLFRSIPECGSPDKFTVRLIAPIPNLDEARDGRSNDPTRAQNPKTLFEVVPGLLRFQVFHYVFAEDEINRGVCVRKRLGQVYVLVVILPARNRETSATEDELDQGTPRWASPSRLEFPRPD